MQTSNKSTLYKFILPISLSSIKPTNYERMNSTSNRTRSEIIHLSLREAISINVHFFQYSGAGMDKPDAGGKNPFANAVGSDEDEYVDFENLGRSPELCFLFGKLQYV